MTRLSALPRPFIVASITDRSPAAAIATMRLARYDGADAYEVNLPALGEVDPAVLGDVFAATGQPVYTSCRRTAFMTVYGLSPAEQIALDEEARISRQLAGLALGAIAIDMEMDTFDPRPAPPLGTPEAEAFATMAGPPAELTEEARAVARQREAIAAAHAAGGEVILSCHTGRPQTTDGLIRIAEIGRERGADLVKIVSPCASAADLFALLGATVALRERLAIPFTLIGAGPAGQLSRSVGCNFGSDWAIGQQALTPGGFHPQPLVAHLRELRRLLPWRFTSEAVCG